MHSYVQGDSLHQCTAHPAIYHVCLGISLVKRVSDRAACHVVCHGVSLCSSAVVQINPMTVYGMLKEHNIPKGEFLLPTAATSVLGRQIISLAKHYGVKTINVVRRKEAVEELKSIG